MADIEMVPNELDAVLKKIRSSAAKIDVLEDGSEILSLDAGIKAIVIRADVVGGDGRRNGKTCRRSRQDLNDDYASIRGLNRRVDEVEAKLSKGPSENVGGMKFSKRAVVPDEMTALTSTLAAVCRQPGHRFHPDTITDFK